MTGNKTWCWNLTLPCLFDSKSYQANVYRGPINSTKQVWGQGCLRNVLGALQHKLTRERCCEVLGLMEPAYFCLIQNFPDMEHKIVFHATSIKILKNQYFG